MALVDRPFDEGVLLAQVEDVILVDPGRDDQQRPSCRPAWCVGVYWRSCIRSFWKTTLPGVTAMFLPTSKASVSAILIFSLPLPASRSSSRFCRPLSRFSPLAFDRLAQHLGVGHDEVGGRHRVDELAGVEVDLLGGLVVQPLDVAHGGLDPARGQQVGLLDEIEQAVFRPGGVAEAPIVLLRLDQRRLLGAQELPGGVLPERHIVLPEGELGLHQLGRVFHHPAGHLEECRAYVQRIDRPVVLGQRGHGMTRQKIAHQLAALLRDSHHVARILDRVGDFRLDIRLIGHNTFLILLHRKTNTCRPLVLSGLW